MAAPQVRTPGGNRANAEDTKTDAAIVVQFDAERKEQANLGARLALAGYSLHELAGGGFLVARHDRTAHCSDLGRVAAFLRQVADGPGWRPS